MKSTILLLIAVSCSLCGFSQEHNLLINSGELLKKGLEQHKQGNYKEAISLYNQISRNDTNYVVALTELGISYSADSQFVEAIRVSIEALRQPKGNEYLLYSTLGTAYGGMKQIDKSIEAYRKGLQITPYNYSLWFNLGVTYDNNNEKERASTCYKQALQYNPFHTASLHRLGKLELEKGHTVSAMMAFYMSLICTPSGIYANQNIIALNNISNVKLETSNGSPSRKSDNFYEIELMIASKIALSDKFKNTAKLNDKIVNQTQLMIDKLQYKATDTGYFMRAFVPYFIEIREKKQFAPFIYLAYRAVNVETIQKGVKKYENEIDAFILSTYSSWNEKRQHQTVRETGISTNALFWFDKSNALKSIGMYDDLKVAVPLPVGKWVYFHNNGYKELEGVYDSNGKREGEWKKYYYSGVLMEVANYTDDVLNGVYKKYYENGQLNFTCQLVSGSIDGKISIYDEVGNLLREKGMKNDKQDGVTKEYFLNGNLESDLVLESGLFKGMQTEFYSTGMVWKKIPYVDGKRNGEYIQYHENGKLQEKGSYAGGTMVGVWMTYYDNGKLLDSGAYNSEGYRVGKWVQYHDNGIKEKISSYDIKGKRQGEHKEYDIDGLFYCSYTFTEGVLSEYVFYDKKGSVVSSGKVKGNTMPFKAFYPDGKTPMSEGTYKNGVKEGEWKYYNANNYLSSKEVFKKGYLDGLVYYYSSSGIISKEMNYKNGMLDGLYKTYYNNKQLEQQGNYVADEKQGYWIGYWPNGNKRVENYYVNNVKDAYNVDYSVSGVKYEEDLYEFGFLKQRINYDTLGKVLQTNTFIKGNGVCKSMHSNGKIKDAFTFKNGLIEGAFISYYSNGKIMETSTFIKGERTKEIKVFEEDGSIAVIGNYKNNVREGKWIYYYPNGAIESLGYYKNGEKDSIWTDYNEKGHKIEEAYYVKGMNHGLITYFAPDTDERIFVRTFVQDYVKDYSYTGKDLKLIQPISVFNETVDYKCYYHTGAPAIQFSIKGGFREGYFVQYYSNGNKQEERTYLASARTGKCITYYSSGNIQSECNYLNDVKDGLYKTFYENGAVQSTEYYMYGELHGLCRYFNKSGNLIKSKMYRDGILF